jgi:hypothetical protein
MKKRSHKEKIDRSDRSSTTEKSHVIARRIFKSQIPESVAEAYDSMQSLVKRDGNPSLEELQGAVEYLLDKLKAARGLNG